MKSFIFTILSITTMTTYSDVLLVPEEFTTIQTAIDNANNGDMISVAAGEYNESLDMVGKAVLLYGRNGTKSTTIDASGLDGSCIVCWSGEGQDTIIAGFTLTGGTGSINPQWQTNQGGGMFIYNASPTILNCHIKENTAEFGGGGIWVQNSESMMLNLYFENNETFKETRGGGGMYCWSSNVQAYNCTFVGNTADSGGAVKCKGSDTSVFTECTFANNTSGAEGGAFSVASSSPTIERSIFESNYSHSYGGALNVGGDNTIVTQCMFSRNSSQITGGAIRYNNTSGVVDQCNFLGNSTSLGGGGIVVNDSTIVVTGCSFQENNGGIQGGAIHHTNVSSTDVDNSMFCGNLPIPITGGWNDLGGNSLDSSCIHDCEGDIDANGTVNSMDIIFLISEFGPCSKLSSCFSDLNDDGTVDLDDLLILINNWGTCD